MPASPRCHAHNPDAPPVDPRLREAVAMALCWAEFPGDYAKVPYDPAGYWATMSGDARAHYYADAESFALAMMGSKRGGMVLVPVEPSKPMVNAARCAMAGLRSDIHARRVWANMIAGRVTPSECAPTPSQPAGAQA